MKDEKYFRDKLKECESVLGFDPNEFSQGSEEWHKMRLGVISASKAHILLSNTSTEKYKTYMNELIAEVCTGTFNDVSAKSIEWGKEHEDAAIAAFEMKENKEVYDLPFIYKSKSMRMGYSPDGLIQGEETLIEVKAPKTSKVHCDFLFDDIVKKEYIAQCQFGLLITEFSSIKFMSYDPRMLSYVLHVKEFERDEKMIKTLEESSSEFIYKMDKKLKTKDFAFGDQWK